MAIGGVSMGFFGVWRIGTLTRVSDRRRVDLGVGGCELIGVGGGMVKGLMVVVDFKEEVWIGSSGRETRGGGII
jgi:hypothetical protein